MHSLKKNSQNWYSNIKAFPSFLSNVELKNFEIANEWYYGKSHDLLYWIMDGPWGVIGLARAGNQSFRIKWDVLG